MADPPRVIVLDTNVLVSALLNPLGPPAQILGLTLAGKLTHAHDARILAAFAAVLRRPEFGFSRTNVDAVLAALEKGGIAVTARPLPTRLPDTSDEPFLEVAAVAGASLVTGNLRHFPRGLRDSVLVLSPREFLDLIR